MPRSTSYDAAPVPADLAAPVLADRAAPVLADRAAPALAARPTPVPADDAAPTTLEVVVPVYNEQAALGPAVRRLHAHLAAGLPWPATITIADNASTDDTLAVATALARELDGVRVRHLGAKGRGRALKAAWLASPAQVVAYMDVDLSTDLAALLPLVAPLVAGHSDVAIGTRLARGARVVRGPKREVISRCYNVILRSALHVRFTDAQCGFKAVRADVARALLPMVADTNWFFDTELLVLAERAGLRIHEVPVDWVDDPDSRVDIVATALEDLRGVRRVARDLRRRGPELTALGARLAPPRPAPRAIAAGGAASDGRASDGVALALAGPPRDVVSERRGTGLVERSRAQGASRSRRSRALVLPVAVAMTAAAVPAVAVVAVETVIVKGQSSSASSAPSPSAIPTLPSLTSASASAEPSGTSTATSTGASARPSAVPTLQNEVQP